MNLKKKNKYLVSGTKYFLDTNTENILKEMSNPEVNNYFGDEFNKEDFFSFIFTPSLFYDSKIAIIKNSEKIKDINDIVNQSSKSIESTIVFLFNEYDLKKIKLENKEQFEIYLEKKITKYNAAKEIVNLFKEKGFSIKQITAEDIYALCLQDINIVKKELEKIEIYYYNQNKPENDKDILDIISFSKNESIFTFIDSFSERKKRLSTYSLDNIISSGESVEMLFYMLSKRIQQLLIYKISPKNLKAHPFVLDKISKSAKLWNIKEIDNLISMISDIDFKTKSGKGNILDSIYLLLKYL